MLSALSAPVCPEQTGIYFCTDCESSHYLLKLKTKKKTCYYSLENATTCQGVMECTKKHLFKKSDSKFLTSNPKYQLCEGRIVFFCIFLFYVFLLATIFH